MFSLILNVRIIDVFLQNCISFFKGLQSVFFEKMNSYNAILGVILISIENFYLIENQKQRQFGETNS